MAEIFPYGRPATGEHLIGREETVKEILDLIRGGQSIVLTAPRKYGKTSVLIEVLKRLREEEVFTGWVDIFDIPSREKLAEKIVISTLENKKISGEKIISLAKKGVQILKETVQLKHIAEEGYEIVLSFASPTDTDALLDEALDFPEKFSTRHKQKMFFAYDEFGDLIRMDGELIKKMRAKFQMQKNTTYLFSGSQETLMKKLFYDKGSAFFGFSRVIYLPKLPENPLQNYIQKMFKKNDVNISNEEASYITSKTDCHPYYTQYLCQIIYLTLKDKRKEINKQYIDACYKEVISLQKPYLDSLWERLMHESILQLNICQHLATGDPRSPYSFFDIRRQNVYRSLSGLVAKGILTLKGKKYSFTDPLFKDYLRMRMGFI